MSRTLPHAVLALLLGGCTGDASFLPGNAFTGGVGGDDDDDDSAVGDDDDDSKDDFSEFDGATLRIVSPQSAEILFTDDGQELRAELLDADGDPMDWNGLVWTSDQEDDPIFEGLEGDVDLHWGIHELTATANLPNGDRLVTTIGGVRVQGRQTGVYAGSMNINVAMEFQGTPVNAACNGGLDFEVDMSGEVLAGGGSCTLNLVVLPGFDVNYDLDAEVDGDSASGDVGVDIGFFALPIGFDGDFPQDGVLTADFSGQIVTFDMTGSIEAERVSLYVDP